MRYFIPLIGLLAATPGLGAELKKDTCMDPEVNQQWAQAQRQYPDDPLVLRLSSLRAALCNMVKSKEINLETARSIWDHALIDALLERAREEQARRGLLRLFGTF